MRDLLDPDPHGRRGFGSRSQKLPKNCQTSSNNFSLKKWLTEKQNKIRKVGTGISNVLFLITVHKLPELYDQI